jgi:DNA (cytosine-5)-methyltransferase 1
MKILNLYAGIGGNRKLWGEGHEITAIEFDENIAKIYKDLYPKDNVIVTDAHQFLLENFMNYDFIWASPPCQSHSSFRQNICVRFRGTEPVYPDMKLYQEIIFLQHNFKGKFVVENVKPYYDTLIKPNIELERHLFWSNFEIKDMKFEKTNIRTAQIKDLEQQHGFDLSNYKLSNKRQVLRNCVNPKLGKHIFDNYLNLTL